MSNVDLDRLMILTNIEVEQETLKDIKDSIDNIINWCNELQSVDTNDIDPMFSVFDLFDKGIENLREDEVTDGNIRDKVLANCSDKNDMFICVPKVIDQE